VAARAGIETDGLTVLDQRLITTREAKARTPLRGNENESRRSGTPCLTELFVCPAYMAIAELITRMASMRVLRKTGEWPVRDCQAWDA
jgi:hypothetical protein